MRFLKIISFMACLTVFHRNVYAPPVAPSLREEAERVGILVGVGVEPINLTEEAFVTALVSNFNMVEPENAMKWSAIRPDRHSFRFRGGDQVVAFARAHGMKVRGHNLAWGLANPAWLSQG